MQTAELDLTGAKVKDFVVSRCSIQDIKDFVEQWHYSKNTNGLHSKYCFKLEYEGTLIGAMIFGELGMANVWKKYAETKDEIVELNRLCCIDLTPKNTESYFIGKCIRWIKQNTNIKKIISYADEEYGHSGTIYRATNFEYLGKTAKGRVIIYQGKRYHDKTIRTRYKGELKPYAKRIKAALESGDAYYVETKSKNIYLMELKK